MSVSHPATKYIALLLFFIFGFSLYSNSLHNNFIYDDDIKAITQIEPYYHQGFIPAYLYILKNNPDVPERPVTVFTIWLNYKCFGMSIFALRVVNVFLHVMASFLLFLLCLRLPIPSINSSKLIAFLVSLFFLVHPLHVLAVNCFILQRSIILVAIFGILALLALFEYSQKNQMRWIWLCFISLILCVFSKPTGIAFFLILPFFAYFLKIKLPKSFYAVLIIMLPVFLILLRTHHQDNPLHWYEYWGLSIRALGVYAQLFFWPFNMFPYYSFDKIPHFNGVTLLIVLCHIFILGYALIILRKKELGLFLSLIGIYLALLPETLSPYPLLQNIIQYRTYCPYIFGCLLMYFLLLPWKNSKILIVFLLIFISMCFCKTYLRNLALKSFPDLGREHVISDPYDDWYNFDTGAYYFFKRNTDGAIGLFQFLEQKRSDQKIYRALKLLAQSYQQPLNDNQTKEIIDEFNQYHGSLIDSKSLLLLTFNLIKESSISQKEELLQKLFFSQIYIILDDRDMNKGYKDMYNYVFTTFAQDYYSHLSILTTDEKFHLSQSEGALILLQMPNSLSLKDKLQQLFKRDAHWKNVFALPAGDTP